MNFTVNVNVTGLEPLVAILEKLISVNPVNMTATPAPVVAPAHIAMAPPIQAQPVAAPVFPDPANAPLSAPVYQAPVMGATVPAPAPAAVPVTVQTYDANQLAVAAQTLMDAGRQNELVALIRSFGVQALTHLPKEHYGTFATRLREMGAKI